MPQGFPATFNLLQNGLWSPYNFFHLNDIMMKVCLRCEFDISPEYEWVTGPTCVPRGGLERHAGWAVGRQLEEEWERVGAQLLDQPLLQPGQWPLVNLWVLECGEYLGRGQVQVLPARGLVYRNELGLLKSQTWKWVRERRGPLCHIWMLRGRVQTLFCPSNILGQLAQHRQWDPHESHDPQSLFFPSRLWSCHWGSPSWTPWSPASCWRRTWSLRHCLCLVTYQWVTGIYLNSGWVDSRITNLRN